MEIARLYDVMKEQNKPGQGESWFLVDRLWPRGVAKESLQLTGWPKSLSPSSELRKEYHGGELAFKSFADRYRSELDDALDAGELEDALAELEKAGAKPPRSDAKTEETPKDGVVLLYGAKDPEENHAVVLLGWLNETLRARSE